jgi:hypothetical protein
MYGKANAVIGWSGWVVAAAATRPPGRTFAVSTERILLDPDIARAPSREQPKDETSEPPPRRALSVWEVCGWDEV